MLHDSPPPQFDELGLKPEDVISKVMSNPELASGFSNPKVQAAIIDISQNPMNIVKYQNDPEVRNNAWKRCDSDWIVASNISSPPFHPSCRS